MVYEDGTVQDEVRCLFCAELRDEEGTVQDDWLHEGRRLMRSLSESNGEESYNELRDWILANYGKLMTIAEAARVLVSETEGVKLRTPGQADAWDIIKQTLGDDG